MADGSPQLALDAAIAAAALEHSPEAFMAVDTDRRVIAWNASAELLTGWAAEQVLGRHPPHWPAQPGQSAPPTGLGMRRHRDGSTFIVLVEREVELRGPDGQVLGHGQFFRAAGEDEVVLQGRNELSRDLVEAVRVDEVRAVLESALTELLQAERGVVLHPCDGFRHLHGHIVVGAHQEEAESLEIALTDDEPARAAAQARRTAIGTIRFGEHESPAAFVPMGPKSAGRVLALVFADAEAADISVRGTWEAVAAETWAALRRAELVADLEGKVEILEATAAVSSSAGLDLENVLETVCRQAAVALSCERAGVYLRDDEGRLGLAHLYATDLDVSVPAGQRAAEEFLKAAEPLVIQDAGACAFLEGPWHPLSGTVSVFGLPLRVGEREIGVLVLAHTLAHPRGFTNLCQQVGDAVAAQAALAIDNARLYAAARTAVAELEELDRLKADYFDGLSHDLRTPLTGLLGFVETLRRTGDTATADERAEYLEVITRQARRIAGMIDDLLTGARLQAGELTPENPEPVSLAELVVAALDALPPDRRAQVLVSVDDLLVVKADRSLLTRAFQNLIDNALQHSPATEQVSVTAENTDREVAISITDHGPGIDEETRKRLFTRYGRAQGRRGSVGLGLYITRGIVVAHGGDVEVASQPGLGTTFTIRLPLDKQSATARR